MARTESQPAGTLDHAVAVIGGVGKRQTIAPTPVEDVLAAWESLAEADALPRVARHVPVLVRALRHARSAEAAEAVARAALPAIEGETRALVMLELQSAQLAQAHGPDDLAGAVRSVLAYADAHVEAARFAQAADVVVRVNEAVFHRELHGEVERSPLAYDTAAFLAPLRESFTYQAMVAPGGSLADRIAPQTSRPAAPAPAAKPAGVRGLVKRLFGSEKAPERTSAKRVLALTNGNLHFASGLLDDLRAHDAEVRVVQIREAKYPRRGHAEMIADRLADAAGHALAPLPDPVAADLAWADVVFVDWFDVATQWACVHVPAGTQLVVRVHSMEAISPQPHLVDYAKVSDLIFVGPHVRDLFLQAVPAASAAGRVHVIANEMRLDRFGQPKTEAAERTLALIGWAQMVKDPLWALELLALLRADDPSWRLLLAGKDFNESLIASGYVYRDAFRERLAQDDVRDGVVELGYRTDLPELLQDAGYILSCSRREGGPVGLTEGAASAAVPIVRDWPMAQPFGGARRLFPDEWIVASPAEAAARIRALDGPARAEAGQAARDYVLGTFDWPVVAPAYREIFLGLP